MRIKDLDPFKVVLIPVIFDPKKRQILIGRRENDPDIPQLTWCFPGGRLSRGNDVDKRLKELVKINTGYDVKNLGTIFSKIYPENEELMAVYFLCEIFKGKERVGEKFKELKWVKPTELEKHFTTSFHPHLKEYIMNLK